MKISRSNMINLHLYFSGVSTFLLLLYILSGSLHLLGFKETKSTEIIFNQSITSELQAKSSKEVFKKLLEIKKPDYKYDYIKGKGNKLTSRPTTREHYTFSKKENTVTLTKNTPNFTMKLMEFHKGHGPLITKKILGSVAIIFALTIFSGVWLGLTVKKFRKVLILTSLTGLVFTVLLFQL